jgi:hypothetical protein
MKVLIFLSLSLHLVVPAICTVLDFHRRPSSTTIGLYLHSIGVRQIRRFTRTLDMLEEPSVRQMSVSGEMIDWWRDQVRAAREKQQAQGQPAGGEAGTG